MAELTPLQKAQRILALKGDIKAEIIAKGQTVGNQLDTYDDKIKAIKTISQDGIYIDGDSNLELDKSAITSVTNNTENTSLDILIDDAGDTLLAEGAGIEASVGYDKVKTAAGITADKILVGKSILDVNGTATDDANAVAEDIAEGKTAYVNGTKITGTLPDISMIGFGDTAQEHILYDYNEGGYLYLDTTLADSLNEHEGKVVPSTQVSACALDTKIATAANITPSKIVSGNTILGVAGTAVELNGETKTVTPSIIQQTIVPSTGKNAITQVTVNAVTSSIDSNIVATNIKDGVTILGTTGTFTSDANATANDILIGKTAYVAGTKITGTSTLEAEKAALEEQLEDLRQELAAITEAEDAEAELNEIIQNLESEILQLKTDKATLEGQVETLTEEKAELQTQLDDLEAVLDDILGESSEPADANEAFDILNNVMGTSDTYDGMGGTEEEILGIMDDILGN